MTSLKERSRAMGPLIGFDPDAFRGNDEVPQKLCDGILTFALVYNDCRDLLLWSDEMLSQTPKDRRLNRFQGEHGGAMTHCMRLLCAITHELGELISEYGKELNGEFFQKRVLSKLNKEARATWQRVLDVAHGRKADKATDDLFYLLRNKASFHFDGARIFAGFDRRFPSGSSEKTEIPLISYDRTIASTRFYFADAAAYTLLEMGIEERRLTPFGPRISAILTDLSVALAAVVTEFIQARSQLNGVQEEPGPKGEIDDLSE